MIPSAPDAFSAPPRGARGSLESGGANGSRSPASLGGGAVRHGDGAIFGGESPVNAGTGAGLLFGMEVAGVEVAGGRGFTATASPTFGSPETISAIK